MNTDESTRLVWEEQIELALNADRKTKGQYILLRSEQLVGAALFVFCKAEHVDRITNVEAHICKVCSRAAPRPAPPRPALRSDQRANESCGHALGRRAFREWPATRAASRSALTTTARACALSTPTWQPVRWSRGNRS